MAKARLKCPKCGTVFEADPQSARCPGCAWAPPAGSPAAGSPTRPAAPPIGAAAAPPAEGASKLAVWAFVCSLLPFAFYALAFAWEATFQPGEDPGPASLLLGVLGVLPLAGPIAAIILGILARRDPGASRSTRNLSLAALIIGSVTLGLYVLMVLLVILFIAACAAACGAASTSTSSGASSCDPCLASPLAVGLATRPWAPSSMRPLRDALAHHPDLPALRGDVFRVAGWRLCVGCFTAYPAFAAALLATWLWPVPAAAAWAAGAALAALQAVSTLGWTRWRWLKVAVKACLGAGAALLLRAVLAAPWPEWAKSLALLAGAAAAIASAQPRRARIARLQAAA